MTLETTVHVTTKDIRQGDPGECDTCPIAYAVYRAAKGVSNPDDYVYAQVFTANAWLRIGKNRYRATLPQSAQDFIGRYDNALPVGPFQFTLQWQEDPL
jgi:hypothetical protein